MLALQTQFTRGNMPCIQGVLGGPKYIRKAVQLPNGSWALVVFELVEINGKIVAKAISGKILEEKCFDQEVVLALPAYFEKESIEPVVSPFFKEKEDGIILKVNKKGFSLNGRVIVAPTVVVGEYKK